MNLKGQLWGPVHKQKTQTDRDISVSCGGGPRDSQGCDAPSLLSQSTSVPSTGGETEIKERESLVQGHLNCGLCEAPSKVL